MGAMNIRKSSCFVISTILLFSTFTVVQAETEKGDFDKGKRIYMSSCEVCHLIGRNLVNPEKEIQNSKLLDDPKKLKEFLSKKNGIMPPFELLSRDDKQLKDLHAFLLYAKQHPSEIFKQEPTRKTKEESGVKKDGTTDKGNALPAKETSSSKKAKSKEESRSKK